MFSVLRTIGLVCTGIGSALLPVSVQAQCQINDTFSGSSHALVTGVWKTPESEMFFKVPEAGVGNNSPVGTDRIDYPGGGKTLDDHFRFRIIVKNKSGTDMRMYFDSSTPLSCVGCSSSVSIPFSKFSWTEGVATETRGNTPGNGQLTGGVQSVVSAPIGTDNLFNLQFNFANDQVYPAGIYKGAFLTRGVPE